MVSNHVKDLIERYGTDGSVIPKALTDYVEARKFYDYSEHSRVGAKHGEFVTDEICDRFSVLGDVDADHDEAARARVDRRRPLLDLPHDPRSGGDARGVREGRHPAVHRSGGLGADARSRRERRRTGRLACRRRRLGAPPGALLGRDPGRLGAPRRAPRPAAGRDGARPGGGTGRHGLPRGADGCCLADAWSPPTSRPRWSRSRADERQELGPRRGCGAGVRRRGRCRR